MSYENVGHYGRTAWVIYRRLQADMHLRLAVFVHRGSIKTVNANDQDLAIPGFRLVGVYDHKCALSQIAEDCEIVMEEYRRDTQ